MKIYGLVIGTLFLSSPNEVSSSPNAFVGDPGFSQNGPPTENFGGDESLSFAAPATVEEPLVEIRGEEWRGLYCGVRQQEERTFREAESWKTFWERKIQPYQKKTIPTPNIDFTNEMVVAVFRGEKQNPLFDVEILNLEMGDATLVVRFKNSDRLVGLSSPRIAVQPFHIKKIRAFHGTVRFERAKE